MDERQLKSFTAVVKTGSFTKAAEVLGISQPTISVHIRALEKELNRDLITRTTKTISVTEDGWTFYEYASRVVNLTDQLLASWSGETDPVIRIACSTVPSAFMLPDLLTAFHAKHPEARFQVTQTDSASVVSMVRDGQVPIGLAGMPTAEPLLESLPFYHDRLVIAAPNNRHFRSLQEKGADVAGLLRTENVILRETGSGSQYAAEHLFESLGVSAEQMHVCARMNDSESIRAMTAKGLGISVISELAVRREVSARKLLAFSLPTEAAIRRFYLVRMRDQLFPPEQTAFMDAILHFDEDQ